MLGVDDDIYMASYHKAVPEAPVLFSELPIHEKNDFLFVLYPHKLLRCVEHGVCEQRVSNTTGKLGYRSRLALLFSILTHCALLLY